MINRRQLVQFSAAARVGDVLRTNFGALPNNKQRTDMLRIFEAL